MLVSTNSTGGELNPMANIIRTSATSALTPPRPATSAHAPAPLPPVRPAASPHQLGQVSSTHRAALAQNFEGGPSRESAIRATTRPVTPITTMSIPDRPHWSWVCRCWDDSLKVLDPSPALRNASTGSVYRVPPAVPKMDGLDDRGAYSRAEHREGRSAPRRAPALPAGREPRWPGPVGNAGDSFPQRPAHRGAANLDPVPAGSASFLPVSPRPPV